MSRSRNIKPSFFTNDILAECEPLSRILFVGLWTIADRGGRLEDRPKKIKAELLPYDNCDAEGLLQQLAKHGFITRYEVDGNKYIQVLNFAKHQNPHMKEAASTIPEPDKHSASTVLSGPLTDSLNLIPDSLNLGVEVVPKVVTPSQTPQKRISGTRLSREWDLPEAWGEWAEQQGMSREAVIRECDKFKDYWISKAGANATKADWEATWRNWIRKHMEGYAA